MTHMSHLSFSSAEANTSCLPSGDHLGAILFPLLRVIRLRPVPSSFITNMATCLSLWYPSHASLVPSGDQEAVPPPCAVPVNLRNPPPSGLTIFTLHFS